MTKARRNGAGSTARGPAGADPERWLVILNPASGRARPGAAEEAVRTRLDAAGVVYELRRTGAVQDALAWGESAAEEGFARVVAVGGDGTVGEVARGLLRSGGTVPLAIVPQGTGNGFARVLRMPMDPGRAVAAILAGRSVPVDVLTVHCRDRAGEGEREEMALVFAGAGLDADINRDADPWWKRRVGFLAYVGAMLSNLARLRPHRMRLTLDGQELRRAAHTVTVINASRMELAGVAVGPDSDPHDGRANVAILRETGFLPGLAAVARLVTRRGSREAFHVASSFSVVAEPPLPVHVDGDVVGRTPMRVTVLPGALQVIAANDYRGGVQDGNDAGSSAERMTSR